MNFNLFLLALCATGAYAACRDQSNCASCLSTPFCGWCSPAPTVFDNGTLGAQCQDQHEFGWHCNHLFSTDKCLVGYVCAEGKCMPDPKGGTGDTKANCEKTCKPPPAGLSTCDTKSNTCVPCKDYCKANSDCPGSYCQGGLCHGSTCQEHSTCNATCSSDTPEALLGVWRGVQMQAGFEAGEYDVKFQKKAEGPQVQFKDPSGAVSSGSVSSDSNQGGKDLTLQFNAGPLAKVVLNGAYDAWEPSPETEQMAFYFGAPGDAKPLDIHAAMNGTGKTAYMLARCSPKSTKCSFAGVFPKLIAIDAVTPLVVDPCNPNKDCGSCVGDKSGLCGWCSQNVVYEDGTPGAQCAGFDKTGKALGWQCKGKFSKTDCSDFGCDFTDVKNPKCMPGKGSLGKTDCATECKPPPAQYSCDDKSKTCQPCDMHYCTSDKQCPGSYCNKGSGAGPWSCHGAVPAGCMDQKSCSGSCNSTETFALCDRYAGQCKPVKAGTPGAQTKYECEHNCQGARPTGTYRGVAINTGFLRGEYDFTFYDDNTMHWRSPDGKVAVAKLQAGSEVVEPDAIPVDGTVTMADDKTIVGKKVYLIMKRDDQGNDDIGKFIFNGFDFAPVKSFDDAMAKTEWVMLGCKQGEKDCDFTKVEVK